jgi:RsmE family RNA methyltransferase
VNLILLQPADFIATDTVRLRDRRAAHIREVLKAEPGARLRVGLLDGPMGSGELLGDDADGIALRVHCEQPPPAKLPLTVLLALPRPKMLRRILRTAAEIGIPRLVLLNTWKVDKSYWQTPSLQAEALRGFLLEGLEQARDTMLPQVTLARRFRPFVEDELPALKADSLGLVAHPGDFPACPVDLAAPCTLAIGPEGGFTPYEFELLQKQGMAPVQLGDRILRVETALPVLAARLFPG